MKKIMLITVFIGLSLLFVACVDNTSTTENITTTFNPSTTSEPTQVVTTSDDITQTTTVTTIEITTVPTTQTTTEATVADLVFGLNPGIDTVEINTAHVDAGAVATAGAALTVTVLSSNVDVTVLGEYEIVYEVQYLGVDYTITRYVFVVDETAPEIELVAGIDTVSIGQTWTDAGVIVTDNSGESLTATVTGTVNTAVAGEYVIEYEATDSSGNTTTISRVVNVIDLDA